MVIYESRNKGYCSQECVSDVLLLPSVYWYYCELNLWLLSLREIKPTFLHLIKERNSRGIENDAAKASEAVSLLLQRVCVVKKAPADTRKQRRLTLLLPTARCQYDSRILYSVRHRFTTFPTNLPCHLTPPKLAFGLFLLGRRSIRLSSFQPPIQFTHTSH